MGTVIRGCGFASGYHNGCRCPACCEAHKIHRRSDYELNKERERMVSNIWRKNNAKKSREYAVKSELKRRGKRSEYNREYSKQHPEVMVRWRKNHPGYQKRYLETHPFTGKLARYLRSRVYKALFSNKKSGKTLEFLGCSIFEFKAHLESSFAVGMTWENYGSHWHIDHIKPCATFDLSDPLQQSVCFHYTNMQPLWAGENFRKSCRNLPKKRRAACVSRCKS